MPQKIYTFGATVYDIIFKDSVPLTGKAGGSMLNTSVSLGRLGLDVCFVTDMGQDYIGDTIISFLVENGVNTSHIERYPNHKTAIAIAFLNEKNDAGYTFYKDFPETRLNSLNLDFKEGDIVLFGSFFAIAQSLRPVIRKFISYAKEKGCIIIYDPNFRKPHLHDLKKLEPFILENIAFSDIVRGSDEDFKMIFGAKSPMDAFDIVMDNGCGNLIYTANRDDIIMMTRENTITASVPYIETVSTIGAGDNFNAGLIWTLGHELVGKRDMDNLSVNIMEKIIANGTTFAAEVCMSYDNYISTSFASRLKRKKTAK
jgi:fructokinase